MYVLLCVYVLLMYRKRRGSGLGKSKTVLRPIFAALPFDQQQQARATVIYIYIYMYVYIYIYTSGITNIISIVYYIILYYVMLYHIILYFVVGHVRDYPAWDPVSVSISYPGSIYA